jgi:hypothetical protein
VFDGQRRRDAIALGAVVGLETLSSIYYGVIGAIGLLTAAAVLAISNVLPSARSTLRPQPSALWRVLRRSLLAAAVAILVALPWSLPYLRVEREAAGGRNLFEAAHGSAVLSSYVQAPETNLLYGRTGWLVPSAASRLPRRTGPEQALFPGFCALLLALIGAVAPPPGLRRTAAVYTTLAVVGIVLSLGPDGLRLLYAALYRLLFGMAAIRAAARFSVLALCGIAILAAIAVRAIELHMSRSGASRLTSSLAIALVFAVIAVEYSNGSIAFPRAPALTSDAGRWLRDQSEPGAVVCLPLTFDTGNTPCMLQSLEHGRRIVNGYSSVRPPFFPALVDAVRHVPSPESLLALHDLGVAFIVSDRPLPLDPASGALVERARFGSQTVYELVWSPVAESAVSAEAFAPPPEPGRPPFAVGEAATYQVHWTSGPMNLSAGEAVVSVTAPHGSEAFRFVVSATTAPWVSRFFEADANLETTVSGRLLPLRNRQTVTDGKRRVERELEFDARDRLVRMTSGGTAVTLPLAEDARDPISALFYVRTLPFQAGAHVRLPLSDNGRPSRLDVTVIGQETIVLDGRPRSAWKLEPRLSERVERQDPLSMVAWVSDDARRVPLRVEVSAGFGSVRLDLASYRDHEETR